MTGITATDFFCGAGGSSTGLVAAGIEVKYAANHWRLAIETHSTNHPQTEHDCADLRAIHAANVPASDIAWFSPECTNHSLAKGKKRKNLHQLDLWGEQKIDPAEERSRATMREVVEFSAYHRYKIVIVENVVDIRYWAHYDTWLDAMTGLGYAYKPLYLNAAFFGVPQSRDRIYVVFWQKGIKAPDLDFRVPAICPDCGETAAYQSWKNPAKVWGRYGARRQYVYRCESCRKVVEPFQMPAAAAIDWTLPVERIGDRAKPLAPKTVARIEAGLRKLGASGFVLDTTRTHAGHNGKVSPVSDPLPTQTTQQTQALAVPFIVPVRGPSEARSATEPMASVTTVNNQYLMTVPLPSAWLLPYANGDGPLRGVDRPMRNVATSHNDGLLYPPGTFITTLRNHVEPRLPSEPLTGINAGGNHHALVLPWMLTLRQSFQTRAIDEPLSTVSAGGVNHALIYNYFNDAALTPTTDPLGTITTVERQALVNPNVAVDDCGFRMLQPHELKAAMSFPQTYVILGSKRDQVKQVGNAVCCNVAEAIARRCVEALERSA